ncbi:MAG: hypothetical protein ACI81R_001501 [Bradymonadia bacterium]|jgi:hypothetical protein
MQLDSAFNTQRNELSTSGVSRITRPSQHALVVQRRLTHIERGFKVAMVSFASVGLCELLNCVNHVL